MLAELTVALMIAGMAAAIGVAILVSVERRIRADGTSDRNAQTTRDIGRMLASEIEASLPESLFVRGDTALDLQAHVGVSVACAVTGAAIVVAGASATSGAPFTFWRQLPEVGDLALLWDTTGSGRWTAARIDSVSSPPAGGGCSTTSGFRPVGDSIARLSVTRLHVDRAVSIGVVPGSPIRVFRGARWFLHRGSDRTWSLAYRRCGAGACGTAQPVAGPVAAAADSGLCFRLGAAGTVEVSVRATAAAVRSRFVVSVRGAANAQP